MRDRPMCFADMDHKTLMRETEERLAGVSVPKLGLRWVAVAKAWLGRQPTPQQVPSE